MFHNVHKVLFLNASHFSWSMDTDTDPIDPIRSHSSRSSAWSSPFLSVEMLRSGFPLPESDEIHRDPSRSIIRNTSNTSCLEMHGVIHAFLEDVKANYRQR